MKHSKKLYLSTEFLLTQAQRTGVLKDLLQSLIEEYVTDERAWSMDLNKILFDYYAQLSNYFDVLMDAIINPATINPETKEEEVILKKSQVELLRSLASMMKILDHELYEGHNISLTLH